MRPPPTIAARSREEETDPDGHRWHSPRYVREWIEVRERDASPEYDVLHRQRLEAILGSIPFGRAAPIAILDLGAGWGRLAHHLLAAYPHARLVALDFSQPMLAEARRRLAAYGDRVGFVEADVARSVVTALGAQFEAVVTAATLHHLHPERLAALYREIHDVLAPGGVLVNLDRVQPRRTAWLSALRRRRTHDATRARHLRMLADAGFATSAEPIGNMTLLVGTKRPARG